MITADDYSRWLNRWLQEMIKVDDYSRSAGVQCKNQQNEQCIHIMYSVTGALIPYTKSSFH